LTKNPNPLQQQTLTENEKNVLASCLALLAEKDPDLAQLVERWPDLPEHIKTTIKTLVGASRKKGQI
jgi:predicted ATPase